MSLADRIYLNPLQQIPGATWIELTQGYYALLDSDLALIAPKFYLKRNNNVNYGQRTIRINNRRTTQFMHRFVFEYYKIDTPLDIDHINRNGLDNRLSNLRAVNESQNSRNSGLYRTNTSGYRGVFWNKKDEKWMAQIAINNVRKHLGSFEDKRSAARAYDKVAIEYLGKFVFEYLNFPISDYLTPEEIQDMVLEC